MSIDGIGAGGLPPGGIGGPRGPSGKDAPGGIGESFSVERPGGVERAGSPELGRLERGEIGLDQYLDHAVNDATRHLSDKLPAAELEFVRDSLREQLRTDPVLVELVKRATGASPADERR